MQFLVTLLGKGIIIYSRIQAFPLFCRINCKLFPEIKGKSPQLTSGRQKSHLSLRLSFSTNELTRLVKCLQGVPRRGNFLHSFS
jgi:hypothetical protein